MDATYCAQRKVTFEDEGNTVMLRGVQLALVAARQGLRQSSPTASDRAALLGGSEGDQTVARKERSGLRERWSRISLRFIRATLAKCA